MVMKIEHGGLIFVTTSSVLYIEFMVQKRRQITTRKVRTVRMRAYTKNREGHHRRANKWWQNDTCS